MSGSQVFRSVCGAVVAMALVASAGWAAAADQSAPLLSIQGMVLDEQGNPLPGVQVQVRGGAGGLTLPAQTTDALGLYEVAVPGEVARYVVTPSKPGFAFTPGSATVWVSGGDAQADFAARPAARSRVAPDAYEPDDVPTAGKTITSAVTQNRTIHAIGNRDWAKFSLAKTSNVKIETNGSSGDTVVYLYGPNSYTTLVAWDDDGGPGLFSLIQRNGLAAGTYYIKVEEYGNNHTIPAYTLKMTATVNGLRQIVVSGNPASGSATGTIGSVGAAELFYFDVPAGQGGKWNLWTQLGSLSDSKLYLDSDSGFSPYVAYNDDCSISGCTLNHTWLHSRIDATLNAGQRYYLKVMGYGSSTGTYTVRVRRVAEATKIAVTNPSATGITWYRGKPHTIQWTTSGSVGSTVKIDLYKGGALNRTIASSVPASNGAFPWTVPTDQALGSDYKIRVSSTTTPGLFDESDNPFAIANAVPATWTILVYLDGDNSLDSASVADFNEMELAASNPNVNIVVCWDRLGTGNSAYFKVQPDSGSSIAPYTEGVNKWSKGELNMGDPATLRTFCQWAIAQFPAQRYALVLWDHGAGWGPRAATVASAPTSEPATKRGACWDDSNGSDYLTTVEVREALAAVGRKFDVVGFDCCLMGMIEVAYELRNVCDYFVGSEETEPGDGWEYDQFIPPITAATTGADLANLIVSRYTGGGRDTLGAFRSSEMATLAASVNSLAATLRARLAAERDNIAKARTLACHFEIPSYVDIVHLMELLEVHSSDAAVDAACAAVRNALAAARVAYVNSGGYYASARGMSLYFPTSTTDMQLGENLYNNYQNIGSHPANLAFTASTQWDEFLADYLKAGAQPTVQIPVSGTPPSGQASGTISASGEADVFYFDVPAGQGGTWNLWTQLGTLGDSVICLSTNADFTPTLACNDDCFVSGCTLNHTGLHSRIDYSLTAGQRYYIRVTGYGSWTGSYTLRVRRAP